MLNNKTICIIGARKGSKRLPGKNRLCIDGKLLFMYPLEEAKKSKLFDQIIFSTDDNIIISQLENYAGIILNKRPPELGTDSATMVEVILYLIEKYSHIMEDCNDICLLTACNPFRDSNHIKDAYEIYKKKNADALISLTEYPFPPELALDMENGMIKRSWTGSTRTDQRQKKYYPNGSVTFFKKLNFLKNKHFYPKNTVGYILKWPYSIDIDYEEEYQLVKKLMEKKQYFL